MDFPHLMIPNTSIAWLVIAIGLGLLLAGRFVSPRRRKPVSHRVESVQIRDDHLHHMLQRRAEEN